MSKICSKIEKNQIRIMELLNKNIDLRYSLVLEKATKFETLDTKFGNLKSQVTKKVKYAVFPEKFKDEDTGKYITVMRRCAVEIDGEKCGQDRIAIKYYTINDIP